MTQAESAESIRSSRRKQTAEVFTPPELTNEILDHLPAEVWEPEKTFCDPSCGNGNMLLEVLKRKLSLGHEPLQALKTIWGVDLMADNIAECKDRLIALIPTELAVAGREILDLQLICHDALEWDFIRWKPKGKKFKSLF